MFKNYKILDHYVLKVSFFNPICQLELEKRKIRKYHCNNHSVAENNAQKGMIFSIFKEIINNFNKNPVGQTEVIILGSFRRKTFNALPFFLSVKITYLTYNRSSKYFEQNRKNQFKCSSS